MISAEINLFRLNPVSRLYLGIRFVIGNRIALSRCGFTGENIPDDRNGLCIAGNEKGGILAAYQHHIIVAGYI